MHATFLTSNHAIGAMFGVIGNTAPGSLLFCVQHLVDNRLRHACSAALIQGVVFQTLAKAHYDGGHFLVWGGQLPLAHFVILLINLPIVNDYIHATFLTKAHYEGGHFFVWSDQLPLMYFVILLINFSIVNDYIS